jgi:hypothetical protein
LSAVSAVVGLNYEKRGPSNNAQQHQRNLRVAPKRGPLGNSSIPLAVRCPAGRLDSIRRSICPLSAIDVVEQFYAACRHGRRLPTWAARSGRPRPHFRAGLTLPAGALIKATGGKVSSIWPALVTRTRNRPLKMPDLPKIWHSGIPRAETRERGNDRGITGRPPAMLLPGVAGHDKEGEKSPI